MFIQSPISTFIYPSCHLSVDLYIDSICILCIPCILQSLIMRSPIDLSVYPCIPLFISFVFFAYPFCVSRNLYSCTQRWIYPSYSVFSYWPHPLSFVRCGHSNHAILNSSGFIVNFVDSIILLRFILETILRPVLKKKKTVQIPEEKHFKASQVNWETLIL